MIFKVSDYRMSLIILWTDFEVRSLRSRILTLGGDQLRNTSLAVGRGLHHHFRDPGIEMSCDLIGTRILLLRRAYYICEVDTWRDHLLKDIPSSYPPVKISLALELVPHISFTYPPV